MSDSRAHPRTPVRTLVTVLCESEHGSAAPRVLKGWTEDISASGMQLACNDELPPGPIYVRILLPGLEDKILECQVLRQRRRQPTGLLGIAGPRFVYGIKFARVRCRAEFEGRDRSLPAVAPHAQKATASG